MSFVTIDVEKAVFEVVDLRDGFDLEVEVDARCPGLQLRCAVTYEPWILLPKLKESALLSSVELPRPTG